MKSSPRRNPDRRALLGWGLMLVLLLGTVLLTRGRPAAPETPPLPVIPPVSLEVYSPAEQMALLRRFEPLLKFQRGERFYPQAVETYLAASELWEKPPGQSPRRLAAAGAVDFAALPAGDSASQLFLTLQDAPPGDPCAGDRLPEAAALPERAQLRGIPSLVSGLFTLAIQVRVHVPDGLAPRRACLAAGGVDVYYARVLAQRDQWILQYWYFYAFNDWRSWYGGANDHEGDWETVSVFLRRDGPAFTPTGAAFSNHSLWGAGIYRPWGSPDLETLDDHPVVYVAGGSHAGYFQPLQYVHQLKLPNASPFVDYAEGTGAWIGVPDQRPWNRVLLAGPLPAWAADFKGRWGWYAVDPYGGEDGPTGPVFADGGSLRRSWANPLIWSGQPDAE